MTEEPKTKRQRLTPEQKIARLKAQLARAQAHQQKRSRQVETREKIIIGAAVVKAMHDDDTLRERVVAVLQDNVKRPIDREVIAPWLSRTSTRG